MLLTSSCTLSRHIGRPEGEVITKKLHDEGRILVRILTQSVEFANGIIKGLLGKVAGALGSVKDFVVENGEVKCKAKANGVGWWKLGGCNIGSRLVGIKRLRCSGFPGVAASEFSKVTMIITLPTKGNKKYRTQK